jgi:putative membrane protein
MSTFSKLLSRVSLTLAFASLVGLSAAAQTGNSSSTSNQSSKTEQTGRQEHAHSSASASGASTAPNAIDRNFLKSADEGNLQEIQLAKLAKEKASSPQVKQFAERMETDHTKNEEQLKALAAKEKITLPTQPNVLKRRSDDKLAKLSGEQFDKKYMSTMLNDHKKDVTAFRREVKMAQNPQVKAYAEHSLPTLESHLKEAENIAPKTQTTAQNTSH